MHLRPVKTHAPIFSKRHSRASLIIYVIAAAIAGLVFGSSPLVWDLLHGTDRLTADEGQLLHRGSGQPFVRGGGGETTATRPKKQFIGQLFIGICAYGFFSSP